MILFYISIAIVTVVLVILFVLPSNIHVERSILINARIGDVFEKIKELKNWNKGSIWDKMDPNQKVEFSESSSDQGMWHKWDSQNENKGKGKMKISESIVNRKLVLNLKFENWGESTSYFEFDELEDGVLVTMYMDSELKGYKKLYGPLMKPGLIKQFNISLDRIKSACE